MAAGFGAFGKMPSVGDFFRLNPPAGFVPVWDDWLQRSLLSGRSSLGADWDRYYMSAPIWRFSLSAGLAGTAAVIGVMMPSVDRVGRQFPLTLMAPATAPQAVPMLHFNAVQVFEDLENLALECLEDDMSPDHLNGRLAEIAPPPASGRARLSTSGAGLTLVGATGGASPPLVLATELLKGRYRQPSFWSSIVQDGHRLLVRDGLPDETTMPALFHLDAPIWRQHPEA